MGNKHTQIKAYGINHTLQLIIGFRTYKAACDAIDKGLLDWAGDRDAYHKLDKEELVEYSTIFQFDGGKLPNG